MRLALAPSDTSALAYWAGRSGHGQEEKDMTGAGNEAERAVSKRIDVPPEVEELFRGFRTCEFSTLTRDDTPIAWPLVPLWQPEERRFVLTASIGLARPALNLRRAGRVSPLCC